MWNWAVENGILEATEPIGGYHCMSVPGYYTISDADTAEGLIRGIKDRIKIMNKIIKEFKRVEKEATSN
jgi:hypothetical protein